MTKPIFPSTNFFAHGKKVRGWLGMMCLGDGLGRSMDCPPWHGTHDKSHVTLATLCSYPTPNNLAVISTFLTIRAMRHVAQELINFVVLGCVLDAEIMTRNILSVALHNVWWWIIPFSKFILLLSGSWQLKVIFVNLEKHSFAAARYTVESDR